MRIDAKEALTKGEEARQEGDGIGDNVMQLSPSESKEIQQEGMGRKRKTPVDVREKKHALISPRARFDLTWTREATPIARKHTVVLIATDLLRRNNGRHPLPADMVPWRSVRKRPAGADAPRDRRSKMPESEGAPAEESKGRKLG